MRKTFLALILLIFCPLVFGQQSFNNDAIIKLVKAGLSDDLIISTINAQPGNYDASPEAIIALKNAGATDKVMSAIVQKVVGSAPAASLPTAPLPGPGPVPATAPSPPPGIEPQLPTAGPSAEAQGIGRGTFQPGQPPSKPRVFLQSASKGNRWSAARDQSMEMGKDFAKDCPDVRITINQQAADYIVALNHIEVGFARDNQFQIANKEGDLLAGTREGGSIDGGMKKACKVILDDWAKGGGSR